MKRTFTTVLSPKNIFYLFSGFKKVKIINLTDVSSLYSQTKFVTICTIALHDFYSNTIEFLMFKIYVNDTIGVDLCTHIYLMKDKYLEVQPGERFSEKTLFMFNMIKVEVRVGAGGREKLKRGGLG